jgi:hypothetical protein
MRRQLCADLIGYCQLFFRTIQAEQFGLGINENQAIK